MEKIYTTIIIGGGVGGLAAARFLEDALLLEQKTNIGERPIRSGEGISYKALKMQDIEPDPRWISCELNAIQRIAPNGKVFGGSKGSPYAYIIDRSPFEEFLAAQSKAKIILNIRVVDLEFKKNFWEVKTNDNKIYKSRYIIGADGATSVVQRKVFQGKIELLPSIQYLVKLEKKVDTKIAKIYLDNENFPQGYAWIFPKSKNTANVGLCCERNNLPEKLNQFLEKTIKSEYGRYNLLENKSGLIPKNGICQKVLKDNALLVGDAASLTDPIFRGGMSQAMLSGKIAAQCILNNEVNLYESKIRSIPFANPKLLTASKILYSLDNITLNELAEVLENKASSSFISINNILKTLFTKPHLRKDFLKVMRFLYIWKKNKDYLW